MTLETSLRPRVGVPYRTRNEEVTARTARLENYLEAARQAGAEPIAVSLLLSRPKLLELAQTLDGLLLTGSPADVDPARFGAARRPECADPDHDRERTDFALLEHALAEHKPVLAICFGIQSLNVFLGGTLVQDIPSEIPTAIVHQWNREKRDPEPFHAARIEPGSQLAQLTGSNEALVNSSHHQSVKEPGRGLRIAARAPDGVIEAVEWTGDSNWVTGVQWHPERMAGADPLAQSLFRSLVSAAAARKSPARV